MKNLHKTLILIPLFIICGFLIYATSYKNVPKKNHVEYPTDMNFCGEKVPTGQADVKERLDREMLVNINLNASTAILIKRANKVFKQNEELSR